VIEDLQLREQPDPRARNILGAPPNDKMPKGSQVAVIDTCRTWMGSGRGAQDADNIWCPVLYEGHRGWANAYYLADSGVDSGERVACVMYPTARGCAWSERQQQHENPCGPEQTFRKGICWDRVIIDPPPGPTIPPQFHGEWCYEDWSLQPALDIECTKMFVAKYALVIHYALGTLQCTPLEVTYGHDNHYQFKGKCVSTIGKPSTIDEDAKIIEGTAWIEDDNLLIDINVPQPTTSIEKTSTRPVGHCPIPEYGD
jgi:hypothetical protein